MIVAHSAPWGWKSCARDGAPQVAIRIPVAAGKMRAGEPEDGLDLRGGLALREQVPRNVQKLDLFEFNDGCEMTRLSRAPS